MKIKPSFRLYWNRFRRGVLAWFFVRGIGRLPKKFDGISDPVERAQFMQEHFGPSWHNVMSEYYAN
jgi:hypothetical protein